MQLDLFAFAQRFRKGRASYRPKGEPIDTRLFEVAPLAAGVAEAFVVQHHYSGEVTTTIRCFGLFRLGLLVGVAIYSNPVNDKSFDGLPGAPRENLELGRLVLLDEVPSNGESWFVARCHELLRAEGYVTVISHADPEVRTTRAGLEVFGGHIGTIYQALNGVYLGKTKPRTLKLFDDGTVFSEPSMCKIRQKKKGWAGAVARLVERGAAPLAVADPTKGQLRAWMWSWLPKLTRNQRHRGNHRYAWALDRAARRHMPESQRFPKLLVTAAEVAS